MIAPLLFLMIGGAPLGFFYKAVNTMDSMVGYKNDKYLYFGRAAAKFDDVLNYIPARLSGMLMCGAAAFCGNGFEKCLEDLLERPVQSQQSQFCPHRSHGSRSHAYSAGRKCLLFWKII